ncbi:hypothetical protein D3C86_1149060 [compost metagenome]
MQDAAGGIKTGIERGQHGGQNDEVHDHIGTLNADGTEEGDERALAGLVSGVGQKQREQQYRADIKHDETQDHGADGARHDLARVFSFARRRADQLNRGIGEHHALYDDEGWKNAVREEAAIIRNEAEAGNVAFDGRAENDEIDANDEENGEREHLDQAEPEFQLAEDLHRQHVHRQHDDQCRHREHPLIDTRQPRHVLLEEIHVEGDGGHIGHRGHGPVQPIHPAGREGHLLAVELAGVGDEGTGTRAMHDKLA